MPSPVAKVLLIEDEDFMHTVLSSYLEQFGRQHSIEICLRALHDPVQGFFETSMHGSDYDLILLDVRLPRISGDRIYESLKQSRPEVLDRILFVTAYDQELKERLDGENLRILNKPFHYNNFETAVSAMLS